MEMTQKINFTIIFYLIWGSGKVILNKGTENFDRYIPGKTVYLFGREIKCLEHSIFQKIKKVIQIRFSDNQKFCFVKQSCNISPF